MGNQSPSRVSTADVNLSSVLPVFGPPSVAINQVDYSSLEEESTRHPLLKVILLTLICSEKFKYEEDLWQALKQSITTALKDAIPPCDDLILGLNIFNQNQHVKSMPSEYVIAEIWKSTEDVRKSKHTEHSDSLRNTHILAKI